MNRRNFMKALGGVAMLGPPLTSALAAEPESDQFFVFIHARGGWDITLFSDPRHEAIGLVDPPSTANTASQRLRHWRHATLEGGTRTFEPLQPPGSDHVFGPAIGDLYDLHDRLTVINGVAMNTVGHRDGTAYAITGSHLRGAEPVAPSIDTMVANVLGREQLLPTVSMVFLSTFIGEDLDPRVVPIRTNSLSRLALSLRRSALQMPSDDAAAVTALLSEEAAALAEDAVQTTALRGLTEQYRALGRVLEDELSSTFDHQALVRAYPRFNHAGPHQGRSAVNAAFAVDAMKNNLVRCVSFALDGLDTHRADYRGHGENLQEIFDIVAALVHELDATPHPSRPADRLSEHTHIMVLSEFARTPSINANKGRDHWPSNSALILSPRFAAGRFGATDLEQLLPRSHPSLGRAMGPPDILATFLSAVGIDPSRYLREFDIIEELRA